MSVLFLLDRDEPPLNPNSHFFHYTVELVTSNKGDSFHQTFSAFPTLAKEFSKSRSTDKFLHWHC